VDSVAKVFLALLAIGIVLAVVRGGVPGLKAWVNAKLGTSLPGAKAAR
jgi:hypothetical protein